MSMTALFACTAETTFLTAVARLQPATLVPAAKAAAATNAVTQRRPGITPLTLVMADQAVKISA